MNPQATVIVSTYEQPEYLDLVLLSLYSQSFGAFEVVVADDGSGPDTAAVVTEHVRAAPFPVRHVWHEDSGFRKTVILNQAVRQAASDTLIFCDGDCIAHRHFVRGHAEGLREGVYLVGRTPRLSRKMTARITRSAVVGGSAQRTGMVALWDYLFGESKKQEFGVYVGSPLLFRLIQGTKKKLDLWGGNFCCRRPDFIRVNGFNEEFLGWGKEDLELGVRLRNSGLQPVSMANRAINFHLWHPKPEGRSHQVKFQNAVKAGFQQSGQHRCRVGYDRPGHGEGS